jgi:hypothetical protein
VTLSTSVKEGHDYDNKTSKYYRVALVCQRLTPLVIKERTIAGLDAARARGRTGGRPKRNPDARKIALAKKFYHDQALSIPDILKTLNISKATLYRWVDINAGNRKKA